jgi:hypothetical protein
MTGSRNYKRRERLIGTNGLYNPTAAIVSLA